MSLSRLVGNEAICKYMKELSYVYLMTSKNNTVLYTGVTNDLVRRVYEHRNKLVKGFSYKYNTIKLVYFEIFNNIVDAIEREKQIKAGSRKNKKNLIESVNKDWNDLYDNII